MTLTLAAAALAFVAGSVRGYCGFGFAMLMALGLMLVLPPLEAVPLALTLDLIASVALWRRAWRHADRLRLYRLLLGMSLATGVGGWLIASIPPAPMRVAVALLALLGAGALLLQRESVVPVSEAKPSRALTVLAGGVCGLCMTLASSGGPPLMLYLLQQRLPVIVLRATAILFFAASSAASLIGLGLGGALGEETWIRAAGLSIPALIGNSLGQRLFERAPPRSLKTTVVPLLMALSVWILLRELMH